MKVGDLIAVYGSLRPGAHAFHLMVGGTRPISLGTLEGANIYNMGPFPALKKNPNKDFKVVVHVLEITDKSLPARLDQYEGYPDFYNREEMDITLENGNVVKAWVYTFQNDVEMERRIVSGDWLNRAGQKQQQEAA